MSADRLQSATALLRQFVADRKISGAVAGVARRGKVVYLEPVGLQSFESRAPMTERSLFRIYSMTKAVTAVAVMMLNEEGKFQLTDPVSKYLPEFKDVMVQDDARCAAAAAVARDHDRGFAAAHLGLEPSDVGPVPPAAGAVAIDRAAAVHHQHHARAADGRSRHPLSLQRGHDGARAAGRSLVGTEVRRVRDRRAFCARSA